MNDEEIILAINDVFKTCFGYDPSDIIGKYAVILFKEEDQRQSKPENEIKNALSKGHATISLLKSRLEKRTYSVEFTGSQEKAFSILRKLIRSW